MMIFSGARSRRQLAWATMAFVWAAMLVLAYPSPLIGDEWVHWHQIHRFQQGDYRIYAEYLTNVPGYHWMVTGLLWPFGAESLAASRVVTALFTAWAAVLVYRIRHLICPEDALRTTLLFFFLPPMFVYGFLAYTDIPALAFLLAALLATLKGRHGCSALALLASMAMRQNNVLWVVFLAVYAAWPQLQSLAAAWRKGRDNEAFHRFAQVRAILALVWPYLAVFAVFCAYWAINGSIAYSKTQSKNLHPDFHPDPGNPILLFALAGTLLVLPLACAVRRMLSDSQSWHGAWRALIPLLAFAVCAWTFTVQHPSNFVVDGNVRNQALQAIARGGWAWWAFLAIAAWGLAGLVFTRYITTPGWLWLPFSIVFVAASWMIETRYVIAPLTLFLVFRRVESRTAEGVSLAGWMVLSLWLALQVFDHRFMI